jgi:hypothetical protein
MDRTAGILDRHLGFTTDFRLPAYFLKPAEEDFFYISL